MKCPNCRHENPDDAKFCNECAQKLELSCPDCGKANPPGSKFCNQCGHDLRKESEPAPRALSFDEKLDKIQRYLPRGLTEKILSQRDKIEGERKQVTVMFCDLEGFTALSERLGPEEAYTIMDQVYEILIHKVHDYEGTVNEMTGDGILALFGAPLALEDAPQRAVRSAYTIHREMARLSDTLGRERGIPPLKMRIGIHTGPVVVGTLGNNLRVEFKAVGDTVNIASRMEGLAEPGTTYVTGDTFKLTEGLFRFEAMGEKHLKGKETPVKVYRVIAPSSLATRFDVSAERGLTPFVGRERELELMLDSFERAKAGRGQVFSIMAEAGVGKSRLLYEFRKTIANEDVTFFEGKCLSYARNVTHRLVIDILKPIFNIADLDDGSIVRRKVTTGLKALRITEAPILSCVIEFLSAGDKGMEKITISPEGKKDRLMESVKQIMIQASEQRPLVIAIEDLHWVDKSSEDCLKVLLDNIFGSRVFLILTYRPEYVPLWPVKSYHNHVTLNRLSNRESLAMIFYLLETDHLDQELQELLLEKTEGVPFFIEEFVKSLKDLSLIEKSNGKCHLTRDIQGFTIPSTIQAVIMARVDALPESVKDVLQTGAVIEREFSHQLIKQITRLPEPDLLSHLSVLKDSELVYERGIFPESTYVFKHALTREVIYESILKKKRNMLHRAIGLAIEELYQDNIEEYYGLLGGHFIEGEDYEKGALYSELAAKKANAVSASKEVYYHAQRRIYCSEKLPPSDMTNRKIIDARTALSAYYLNYAHMAEAYEVVAPIAILAEEMNYQRRLPMIYLAKGEYSCWFEEKTAEGLEYLRKALNVSERIGSMLYYFNTCWQIGTYFSWDCQFSEGRKFYEKCLELSKATEGLLGISAVNSALCIWNYLNEGNIELASQAARNSLIAAEKSEDVYARGLAYSTQGILSYFRGILDEAEEDLLKGLKYLETTNQVTFMAESTGRLGRIYADRGDYEKAHTYYEKARSTLLEHGRQSPSWINLLSVCIAKAKLLSQRQDIDLGETFEHYEQNKSKSYRGQMAREIGDILFRADDRRISEAQDWVQKAIEADHRNGMKWQLAQDYALYAQMFQRQGNLSKAKENLNKAIEIFKECGADGWVEKYDKEIAALP